MKRIFVPLMLASGLAAPAHAGDFSFTFDWSGLKLCNSGYPNRVTNPPFALKNVPKGTKFIRFRLQDKDAPMYEHGGGIVAYSGQKRIKPGAFSYESPCPPFGHHRYQWTAIASKSRRGGRLATARAETVYP